MQLHKKIFIVALVLSICISLYFLINPSNIFTFPIRVHSFDDTFKYYMFVKIGIVLLFTANALSKKIRGESIV